MKGCFIVFEGIDGAGKTEQLNRLSEKLQDNYSVILTREPTTTNPIGRLIRNVLYKEIKIAEEALALLFAADRADHTINTIIPSIKEGSIIISDRYVYSSFAYQSRGMKKELDLEWLKIINKYVFPPDIIIFLDLLPEMGLARLQQGQTRVQDHTYFEDLIQQERIRSVYYQIFNFEYTKTNLFDFIKGSPKKNKDKITISRLDRSLILRVDGTQPIEVIEKQIYKIIKSYLEEKKVPKMVQSEIELKTLQHFNEVS